MEISERSELRGQILDGRYRVGAPIGSGGTGLVFEAERLATLETVVVKTLRPMYAGYPDLVNRLRREIDVAQRVYHPGIVPIVDTGMLDDGSPYIVMPYLKSESLFTYLRRNGRLNCAEAAIIGTRVASILHSVHGRGYVHRDVKPEHIMLGVGPGQTLSVHLLDFGVCASETAPIEEKRCERGRVFGTPSYCSPEQAAGDPNVDGRADLFGLGITMFEALSGRLPFVGTDVNSILRRIIREDAPRLGLVTRNIDLEMEWIVLRLLARNPADRFSNARALMREFTPWVADRESNQRRLCERLLVGDAAASLKPTSRGNVVAA
ncbi:MAG: serine/threonine-protein kinase [Polyangiales bacterium]